MNKSLNIQNSPAINFSINNDQLLLAEFDYNKYPDRNNLYPLSVFTNRFISFVQASSSSANDSLKYSHYV